MSQAVDHLWAVAGTLPHVDAAALAHAVEAAAASPHDLDCRSRLLIRDSVRALESHWGLERVQAWMHRSVQRHQILQACDPAFFDPDRDEVGFPSLSRRVADTTKIETVTEFFTVLSQYVRQPTRLTVGGSIALMLGGILSRHTEDINVVNEIPPELRDQHQLLEELATRFGLKLAHFQSHYLRNGWEHPTQSFQAFDQLNVRLVDRYDVVTSKLCSNRAKDLDDLRALKPHIDRGLLKARLTGAAAAFLSEPNLRGAATKNWRVLFQEDLPQ